LPKFARALRDDHVRFGDALQTRGNIRPTHNAYPERHPIRSGRNDTAGGNTHSRLQRASGFNWPTATINSSQPVPPAQGHLHGPGDSRSRLDTVAHVLRYEAAEALNYLGYTLLPRNDLANLRVHARG
jgi:hypothetical protein